MQLGAVFYTCNAIQIDLNQLMACLHSTGIPPELDMSVLLYIILGVAAGLKVLLYGYCVALQKQSESMLALAEDHRNDIMSNVVAILTGALASWWHEGWWIDPVGGILISLYIIYSWGAICKEQVLSTNTFVLDSSLPLSFASTCQPTLKSSQHAYHAYRLENLLQCCCVICRLIR